MHTRWTLALAIALAMGVFSNGPARAVTVTMGLGSPSVTGSVATMDVFLEYTADPFEEIVFFSIDVSPSDPALYPALDFSAFSFSPASPLLDDWFLLKDFDEPLTPSTVEYDTVFSPLAPGVEHTLGELSVDFGGAGFAPGDMFEVGIDGFFSIVGADLPDPPFFDFFPVDFFDPGFQKIMIPGGPSGPGPDPIIPEPSTFAIWSGLAALGAIAIQRQRSRQRRNTA